MVAVVVGVAGWCRGAPEGSSLRRAWRAGHVAGRVLWEGEARRREPAAGEGEARSSESGAAAVWVWEFRLVPPERQEK